MDVLLNQGSALPGLDGRLMLTLHGYRDSGNRIVSLSLQAAGVRAMGRRTRSALRWRSPSVLTPACS